MEQGLVDFVVVDARPEPRRPSDHVKLTDALTKAGLANLSADRLSVDRLEYDRTQGHFDFQAGRFAKAVLWILTN